MPLPGEPVAFSRDGRLLRISIDGDERGIVSAIVDVERGEVVMMQDELYSPVFSADGRWLIGHGDRGLIAIATDGSSPAVVLDVEVRGSPSLAVLAPR